MGQCFLPSYSCHRVQLVRIDKKKEKEIVEFRNRGSFGSLELMNELFEVKVDDR